MPPRFEIVSEPIDAAALQAAMANPQAGGFVAFEGWTRDVNEGRPVVGLEYSAHRKLAEKEGRRILEEALERFDILGIACQHRVGSLALGDKAVWVGASAAHRGPAFEACRYVIDEVKRRVPIWKRESYADGSAQWVNSRIQA